MGNSPLVMHLSALRMGGVRTVDGKNASLGAMIISQLDGAGVRVPAGFATTAQAYREFLLHNGDEMRRCAGICGQGRPTIPISPNG